MRIRRAVPLALLVCAAALRLVLLTTPWPPMRADEATMGLMAIHITHGARPLLFYGQDYMGSLEAFLAAPLFLLFGPSTVALRLPLVALYLVFLLAIYLLGRRLAGSGPALVALIMLALGSQDTIWKELEATGGYMETLACGALLLLFGTLALCRKALSRRAEALLFGGWGLVAGLGLWSDFLVAPFVAASILLMIGGWWRRGHPGLPGVFLCVGLLVGGAPLIMANMAAAPGHDSLHTVFALQQASAAERPNLIARLAGAALIAVPVATGAGSLCPSQPTIRWPLPAALGPAVRDCGYLHAAWGLAWLFLYGATACGAMMAYLRRRDDTETVARLAVLSAVGLTFIVYAISPIAATNPRLSARYLIGLSVGLPLMLATLARLVQRRLPMSRTGSSLSVCVSRDLPTSGPRYNPRPDIAGCLPAPGCPSADHGGVPGAHWSNAPLHRLLELQ